MPLLHFADTEPPRTSHDNLTSNVPRNLAPLAKLALIAAMVIGFLNARRLFDVATSQPSKEDRMFAALALRDRRMLKDAIAEGAAVDTHNEFGTTLLMDASSLGDVEVAQLLIARGANINATDMFGNTPLMCAASTDEKRVVDLLLRSGASASQRNQSGQCALDIAIVQQADSVAQTLRHAADSQAVK